MSGFPSVVVFGPQACGKTRNAEALRKGLGLSRIIDDFEGRQQVPRTGALVLTNSFTAACAAERMGAQMMDYATAARGCRVKA